MAVCNAVKLGLYTTSSAHKIEDSRISLIVCDGEQLKIELESREFTAMDTHRDLSFSVGRLVDQEILNHIAVG